MQASCAGRGMDLLVDKVGYPSQYHVMSRTFRVYKQLDLMGVVVLQDETKGVSRDALLLIRPCTIINRLYPKEARFDGWVMSGLLQVLFEEGLSLRISATCRVPMH
jgi:hypothetical protein